MLIEAWGERYLELSRGNLKQKHWKDVTDIVSSCEDYTKTPKTDIQCKNRIDTVKKKYTLVFFIEFIFFIFLVVFFFFGFSQDSLKHKIFPFFVVLQRLYYEGRRGFSNFLLMNSDQLYLPKYS